MPNIDVSLTPPPRIILEVTQNSHGFSVGNVLKVSGTNTFALAQADTQGNSRAVGIVTQVVNANEFVLTLQGRMTSGVPAAAAGTIMYLSDSVAGALTSTAPASNVTPVLVVLENAISAVVLNALQGGGSGGAFIPLAGTGIGAPVTGDIEITDGGTHKIYQDDGSVQNILLFIPGIGAHVRSVGTGKTYSLSALDISGVKMEANNGVDDSIIEISVNTFADSGTYPFVNGINSRRIQFNGQAAPTINDDVTLGYGVDSFWIYDGGLYICTSATTGAAVWNPVGGTINSGNQYRIPYYSTNPTGTTLSEAAAITDNRALISDANGVPTHSATTAAQLGYLQGISAPAIGDIFYFDGTNIVKLAAGTSGYHLEARGAAAPVWAKREIFTVVKTISYQTTSDVYADINNGTEILTAALEANSTYSYVLVMQTGCSGTGGLRHTFTYPAGATVLRAAAGRTSGPTAITSYGNNTAASGDDLAVTYNNAVSENGQVVIHGSIMTAGTAGDFRPQIRSITSGQTSTIHVGSFLKVTKES
jgi:hypothetical protein